MAISAGDFRTGLTLIIDGDPCQVLDFNMLNLVKEQLF